MNRQFVALVLVLLTVVLLTTLLIKNYDPGSKPENDSEERSRSNAIYAQLGRAYASRASGDLDSCERLLRRILETEENNIYALTMLGDLCFSQKRYSQAARVYAHLTGLAPNNAAVFANYGVALAMQEHLALAREAFARAVELAPGRLETHWHLAAVEAALGHAAAARAELKKMESLPRTPRPEEETAPYFSAILKLRADSQAAAERSK